VSNMVRASSNDSCEISTIVVLKPARAETIPIWDPMVPEPMTVMCLMFSRDDVMSVCFLISGAGGLSVVPHRLEIGMPLVLEGPASLSCRSMRVEDRLGETLKEKPCFGLRLGSSFD